MGKNANCRTCLVSYNKNVDSSILELRPDDVIYEFGELANRVSLKM